MFLGEISYVFYLIQIVLIGLYRGFIEEAVGPSPGFGFIIALMASILVAAAIHLLVETPARRIVRRNLSASQKSKPQCGAPLSPATAKRIHDAFKST